MRFTARTRTTRSRRHRGSAVIAVVAVVAIAAVFAGTTWAASMQSAVSACGFTATGAPWTFKGQKGTTYTVVALAGASCATTRKWISRLTHERAAFDLKSVPAGWHCSTTGGVTTGLTKTGQCTTPGGGIVEWLPKLKK